jgi:hypothetical protein
MNIYLELTKEFNAGRLRCMISSGQAVVLHRLAIKSKDGDWIIREDAEAMQHIVTVLARHAARYRFGAPLDPRWLRAGWSAHFEFRRGALRVRTDFVSRPPRLSETELAALWRCHEHAPSSCPFVDAPRLAEIKKTNREKDYVVIGELARRMPNPTDQFLYSRSATDLIALAGQHPQLVAQLAAQRSVLETIPHGRDALETAIDAERRHLTHANEERLQRYARAAQKWATLWPAVERETRDKPLPEAHTIVARRAEGTLPFQP